MTLWYPWIRLDSTYGSPEPPKTEEKMYNFVQFKMSLSDYFHILLVGERIAEKQDGSTMIIEGPPGPPNKKKSFFHDVVHIHEKPVVHFCHCCT